MARKIQRTFALLAGTSVALSLASACTLTGPLDGYAEGDPPPGGQDAGQDVSDDQNPDVANPDGSDCPTGYGDCDGDPSNGCETNLGSDLAHCGTCSNACSVDHGSPSCVQGACGIASCDDNFANCDDDVSTGCETDTTASPDHCGSCDNPCAYDNADGVCTAGACSMGDCNGGYADCDDDASNGCEIHTETSVDHCGTCDHACEQRDNSTPRCQGGECALLCNVDYGDCDGDETNGCEANTRNDVAHCGACGQACSTEHATPSCVSGTCLLACDADYADCDGDRSTGCESATLEDPDNCGGCGTVCTAPAGAAPACDTGTCSFVCNTGLGDCNSDSVDGCETDVTSDADSCGACGRSCLGGACTNGQCPTEQLATGLNRPSGMVLNNTHVFWTDAYDNAVYSVPKGGGGTSTIATGGAYGPITRNGSNLYYATGAAIARVSVTGGSKTSVVTGETYVPDLTNDGSELFWLRRGTFSGSTYNNDGAVAKAPIGGGSVTVLASGQQRPVGVVADASSVYWVNEGTYTGLVHNGDGSVLRVAKTGGAVTSIAVNQAKPCGIVLDATTVYWSNCGDGTLMKRGKAGGTAQAVRSGQSISGGLFMDGTDLFWPFAGADASQPTGDVRKAAIDALDVLVLADTQIQPYRVAADATHAYWINYGGEGSTPPGNAGVMRVPR